MEDPYPVENIDRLGVLMLQTSNNSQLLRRVLWISAEQTIGASLKHKNTQPLYMFNRVRVLHLNRLKERTWLHSFANNYIHSCNRREVQLYYRTALHFTTIKPYLVGHNLNKMSKKQVLVGICLLDKLANTRTTKARAKEQTNSTESSEGGGT